MNRVDQENFLLKLGWNIKYENKKSRRRFIWKVTSATVPGKVVEFKSLREIDECLKRKLQSEMAVQQALQLFDFVYSNCSISEEAKLIRWMSTGHRHEVWHLTNDCIYASHRIPQLPRRWRTAAIALLPTRLDRPYEEFWKRAAERFLKA